MKPVKSQPDAYAFQIKTIWKDSNGTDLIQMTQKLWKKNDPLQLDAIGDYSWGRSTN